MKRKKTKHRIWKDYSLENGKLYSGRFGQLSFWIKKEDREYDIAWEKKEEEENGTLFFDLDSDGEGAGREDLSWSRYICPGSSGLVLSPVLVNRPVVLRAMQPLKVLPREKGVFFIYLPAGITISGVKGEDERIPLTEMYTRELSTTWFGEPSAGELCYSLESGFNTDPFSQAYGLSSVIIPLTIRNDTPEVLDFERICLRAVHLFLYASGDILSTNSVIVVFRGADQISQITYGKNPPDFLDVPELIVEPRIKVEKSIIQKSFHLIKTITNW